MYIRPRDGKRKINPDIRRFLVGRKINLKGKTFGELEVIEELPSYTTSGGELCTKWKCKCSCGKITEVFTSSLRSGATRSCSHLQKEIITQIGVRNRKQDPRLTSIKALFKRMINSNARRRGLKWNLSLEQFESLVFSKCYWCGEEPFTKYNVYLSKNGYTQRISSLELANKAWILFNGIDRKDNAVGYEIENCLPCCKHCNFARNTMTMDEFLVWIERIAKHALSLHK
jgi:hypothetical protein